MQQEDNIEVEVIFTDNRTSYFKCRHLTEEDGLFLLESSNSYTIIPSCNVKVTTWNYIKETRDV